MPPSDIFRIDSEGDFMREKWRLHLIRRLQGRKKINTMRVTVLTFLAIILVGTLLLMLPAASRNGQSCGFHTALFTATSTSCVTGLILVDTWTQWSGFGQLVLLLLIQIGGLGFMSFVCIFLALLRRRMGMRHRMILVQSLNLQSSEGLMSQMKRVLMRTLRIEGCGALILTVRFCFDFPFDQALWRGIFHSVSAFCNAGFDLLGNFGAFGSVAPYATDPVVMLTLSALIALGGLGFFVWDDILRAKKFSRMTVYTRLVLVSSAVLTLGGMVATLLLEWDNPATLGDLCVAEKILAALFQSVTLRTAGFDALGQGNLTEADKLFSCLIMLVGGSSGSTAGGIKTVTVTLLLLAVCNAFRGRERVVVWGRRIPDRQIFGALSVALMVTGLALIGGAALSLGNDMPVLDCLYETCSAIATVGTTTGITTQLNLGSQVLLICYMFFGRVGVMTISLAFLLRESAEDRIYYPETQLMIG